MSNPDKLKSGEISGGIKIVIADDEKDVAARTNAAWNAVLNQSSLASSSEVTTAKNGNNLLAEALGLESKAADVVVLDHEYRINREDWKPTEDVVKLIAQKRSIPFDPIQKPDRGPRTIIGIMPDDLYQPDSVHFALLLRYLGFSGKIIVISGGPPDPKYIDRETNDANEYFRPFNTQIEGTLIDGVLTKLSRYGECHYATKTDQFGWVYSKLKIEDFSDAVNVLVDHL